MPEILIQSPDGGQRRFPLAGERVTIGRSRESDIFLPDQWLSRHHAEIRISPQGSVLVDLGSKNGTLLNDKKIAEEQPLHHGDVVTLGEHRLTFQAELPAPTPVPDEPEPVGTRVFSARELSDLKKAPASDTAELTRQNRVLRVLTDF